MRATLLALLSTVLTTGCTGEYTATYSTAAYGPDLVYASPGVQVIADWNEPVFFVDGIYWRFSSGTWYRSSYYTGGWSYAPPPPALLTIEPHRYVHYRPSGWTPRHYEARPAPPLVRDHRTLPPPSPIIRDHRTPPPPPPPRHDRDRDRGHDRDHRR